MARPKLKTTQDKLDYVNAKIEETKTLLSQLEQEKCDLETQLKQEKMDELLERMDKSGLSVSDVIALINDKTA